LADDGPTVDLAVYDVAVCHDSFRKKEHGSAEDFSEFRGESKHISLTDINHMTVGLGLAKIEDGPDIFLDSHNRHHRGLEL
jgi:hypothetical protein